MLAIENLSIKLGKKKILDGFNCVFETGVHGLLGPNGAGKTTLMRTMLGLYPKATVEISVNGEKVSHVNAGYLPQKFGMFPGMTVREGLRYLGTAKKLGGDELEECIEKIVEDVNLSEKIDSKISSLSGGMVRRLGIAQTFLGNPEIIIFDEPTAGLDPEERLRFKNLVKENKEGHTIIISTHIVDDVDYLCDHVEILDNGILKAQGSCDEIKARAKSKVYGALESELKEDKSGYFLEKEYETDGNKMLRILSSKELPYQSLKPELEDGFLCILKGL